MWRYEAHEALRQLGGAGTLSDICEKVEARVTLTELNWVKDGTGLPQWNSRINWHLSQSDEFEKTDSMAASLTDGHRTRVWQLVQSRVPERPEEWPEGKPRERTYKWKNAKERAKGLDGVHANHS